ncbi:hypothetical protein [Riemerella columbipharyngis]|uniref:Uncharacterized protein n=1 Tax=Riemerella columbipharyngis TaxID=1071918 RepID=A0A1G6ZNM6_9FLAO|nr:hypothetical protein [Riemerella columbipharyngis]SDE03807.1 hypothetical protein SAMN05421544_102141 [Riemerella columbipharyngis]
MKLKIRLIKLKRVIDTKLANNSVDEKPLKYNRIGHFLLKDKFDKQKFVSLLYSKLISKNFIECSIEDFETIFEENKYFKKIQWKGTELQLTFLINSLLKFFDTDINKKHYKLMETYFINKIRNYVFKIILKGLKIRR